MGTNNVAEKSFINNTNIYQGKIYIENVYSTKDIVLKSEYSAFVDCQIIIAQNITLSFKDCIFERCEITILRDTPNHIDNVSLEFDDCSIDHIKFTGERYRNIKFINSDIDLIEATKLPVFDSIEFIRCPEIRNILLRNTIVTVLKLESNALYKNIDLEDTMINDFILIDSHKKDHWKKEFKYDEDHTCIDYTKKVVRRNGKKKD